jgi:hypothetical protein
MKDLTPVSLLASLYVDETLVRAATRRKLLVMGMAAGTMRVLNPEVVDDGRK